MRIILLSCLAVALALLSFRSVQSFTVHGKITDDHNQPLAHVSIMEKGTSNGTTTDSKGEFVLTVQSEKSQLIISYLGFERKEVAIKGQSNLNVSLATLHAKLDEVVVTGMGRDAEPSFEYYQKAAPSKVAAQGLYHRATSGKGCRNKC